MKGQWPQETQEPNDPSFMLRNRAFRGLVSSSTDSSDAELRAWPNFSFHGTEFVSAPN